MRSPKLTVCYIIESEGERKVKCCKCGLEKEKSKHRHGSVCDDCFRIYHREWCRRNREKVAGYAHRRYEKTKYQKPERLKDYQFRANIRRFGLTVEGYARRLQEQNFVCAICGCEETAKAKSGTKWRLAIDHCHRTGRIRGLLCWKCNINLHKLEESGWLEKALRYLGRT